MNFSVILAYAVLLFEMIFIIAQGGKNMTSEIIAAIIAGIVAVVVAVIGNVITFLKARHNEKNEHDNLEKEHEDLSKGQNSILEAQKENTTYLEKVTKEQVGILNEKQTNLQTDLKKLSEESIRMSEMQKQVKEHGVDTEKMIANIQALIQMNASNASQIRQLTEENRSLKQNQEWMQNQIRDLKEEIREKDRFIWELQHPLRDDQDWNLDR